MKKGWKPSGSVSRDTRKNTTSQKKGPRSIKSGPEMVKYKRQGK